MKAVEENQRLGLCQERIGYQFKDTQLLERALTHSSGATTRLHSYERLEFLGDAVLGLVVCEFLYLKYPEETEGNLTHRKSTIVSRDMCAQWCRQMGLDAFLMVGKGVSNGGVSNNIIGDIFEAVLGAMYVDGGMEPVKRLVWTRLEETIPALAEQEKNSHLKSQFQQHCQKVFAVTPHYLVVDEQGPDHCKCFKVAARVHDRIFPAAWANTKKEAEQKAAANALALLSGDPVPYGES